MRPAAVSGTAWAGPVASSTTGGGDGGTSRTWGRRSRGTRAGPEGR